MAWPFPGSQKPESTPVESNPNHSQTWVPTSAAHGPAAYGLQSARQMFPAASPTQMRPLLQVRSEWQGWPSAPAGGTTQVLLAELQTSGVGQSELARHCTQVGGLWLGSQTWAPAGQSALLLQPGGGAAMQAFALEQRSPAGQSEVKRHCTQLFPAGLCRQSGVGAAQSVPWVAVVQTGTQVSCAPHLSPAGHCDESVQATQVPVGSQIAVGLAQSPLLEQRAVAQVFCVLHVWPALQSAAARHATQECGEVAVSQRGRPGVLQSVSTMHCAGGAEQVLSAWQLDCAGQSALPRQATQTCGEGAVSQRGVAGLAAQSVSVAHCLGAQVSLVPQALPAGHWLSLVHCTQTPAATPVLVQWATGAVHCLSEVQLLAGVRQVWSGEHCWPDLQSVSTTQTAHLPVPTTQRGVGLTHWASLVQPLAPTQWWARSQLGADGFLQSMGLRHCTQTRALASQTGRPGLVQSALLAQPGCATQSSSVHSLPAPQSRAVRHCTQLSLEVSQTRASGRERQSTSLWQLPGAPAAQQPPAQCPAPHCASLLHCPTPPPQPAFAHRPAVQICGVEQSRLELHDCGRPAPHAERTAARASKRGQARPARKRIAAWSADLPAAIKSSFARRASTRLLPQAFTRTALLGRFGTSARSSSKVRLARFERAARGFEGRCSIQLSYRRVRHAVADLSRGLKRQRQRDAPRCARLLGVLHQPLRNRSLTPPSARSTRRPSFRAAARGAEVSAIKGEVAERLKALVC